MNSPDARPGPVSGKIIISSLVGLAAASITGFALLNASQSTSNPVAQTPPSEESAPSYSNTVEITREEALARFGEEATRKRALAESERTNSVGAAQLVFLDENGNRVPGRIQDIQGSTPQPVPKNPIVTWPGLNGGVVADTSHIRVYTNVSINPEGELEKDYVTGTLADAQDALQINANNQTHTDPQELKEQ